MTTRGIAKHAANVVLVAAFGASVAISGMTHDAPLGEYVGTSDQSQVMVESKPVNVPDWQPAYGDRFAGCAKSLPSGVIPSTVVVVEHTGDVSRMKLDQAWDVAHDDNAANDVWVVGSCR